jgi:hypothetical protein
MKITEFADQRLQCLRNRLRAEEFVGQMKKRLIAAIN